MNDSVVLAKNHETVPDLLSQPWNDYGNCQRLLASYPDDLKYCPPMRKFLIWDGQRYKVDDTERIRKLTQNMLREFAIQALQSPNNQLFAFATKSLNSPRISGAIRETQPLIAVLPEALDADQYALNCLNGTVDLRTGTLRRHSRNDLITRLVPHRYDPNAECPVFMNFFERIVAEPIRPFLLKALGYSLTGITREKAVFILHGPTNTGKTTLLELWHDLLADYSTEIDIESLMTRQEDNNSRADLAKLQGARFAITNETKQGQRLNEAKLKRLSKGQGQISTVRKYEDWISFLETHKLFIDANHRPVVSDTDDAIWSRLFIFPFECSLAPDEVDRNLPEKLRSEREMEGILALGVRQCISVCQSGLGSPPKPVSQAKNEWRRDMDRLTSFIETMTIRAPNCICGARPLFVAYCQWMKEAGEQAMAMTEPSFSQRMKEMGFEKKERRGGNFYLEIGLRSDVTQVGMHETGHSRQHATTVR
jgi:putative DNA primase/helicase